MVAVTYGIARVPTSPHTPAVTVAASGKSAVARFFNAMLEARRRAAEREIARYAYLLDGKIDAGGNPLKEKTGAIIG